jgi:hypothetical protein
VVCLAPRAPGDSVRPRRLADASVRPLNFTVRGQLAVPILAYGASPIRRLYFWR